MSVLKQMHSVPMLTTETKTGSVRVICCIDVHKKKVALFSNESYCYYRYPVAGSLPIHLEMTADSLSAGSVTKPQMALVVFTGNWQN